MSNFDRVQAVIDLDNIRHNVKTMKSLVREDMKMLVVIKADAYGHGSVAVGKALVDLADFYAVACVDEAVELKKAGIETPVLILGYTDPSDYGTLIENQVRPAIYDYHGAELLSAESVAKGKVSPIHIKLDTGMSRIGFQCTEESLDIIEKINSLPGIYIEGIFTHYAKADELDKSAAKSQLQKFRDMCSSLKDRGVDIPLKHISNSAGIMEMDNEGFDMVRCGIVTYGLYPSEEVDKERAPLKPAMSLMSRIIHVKQLEKGRGIGYGWSYVTDHDMKVATVSAGYADGYPRAQSNLGRVIIHGKYAPIIGRVCMDQFMVDVSDIDEVNVGDYVTLVGREGNLQITVEEVAEPANSFNYELVCNVSRRVPRVYIKDGVRVSERNYLES